MKRLYALAVGAALVLPPSWLMAVSWAGRAPPTVQPDLWTLALHGVIREPLPVVVVPPPPLPPPVLPVLEEVKRIEPPPPPPVEALVPPPAPPKPVSQQTRRRVALDICAAHHFRRVQHGLSWHCSRW